MALVRTSFGADLRITLVAPRRPHVPLTGMKASGWSFEKLCWSSGRELDHGASLVGIAESGEDFSGDAEVGMVHVMALFGFGE